MIKAVVFDFAKVLLFAKDQSYQGRLNPLWNELSQKPDFKFFDHFQLNEELLNEVKKFKEQGLGVYILTSEKIQEDPAIKDTLAEIFDNIFSALRMGKEKTDPEVYKEVAQEIQIDPTEIVYVDDNDKFVEAAKSAGLNAFKYESNAEIVSNIRKEVGF